MTMQEHRDEARNRLEEASSHIRTSIDSARNSAAKLTVLLEAETPDGPTISRTVEAIVRSVHDLRLAEWQRDEAHSTLETLEKSAPSPVIG